MSGVRWSLQFLLGLARAVFLESESSGTQDHVLLSQVWGSLLMGFRSSKFVCFLATAYMSQYMCIRTELPLNRKIWSWVPKGCPTTRWIGRLTVGHNGNSTKILHPLLAWVLGTVQVYYKELFWDSYWTHEYIVSTKCKNFQYQNKWGM
jgi:hypothetical protein